MMFDEMGWEGEGEEELEGVFVGLTQIFAIVEIRFVCQFIDFNRKNPRPGQLSRWQQHC